MGPAVSPSLPQLSPEAIEARESLRRHAGEFVGNIFYGTLLKELQNTTLKSELFHGGRGEEAFRGMLNMELARRMGQSPGDPIANRIYEVMVRNQDGGSATPGRTATATPIVARNL